MADEPKPQLDKFKDLARQLETDDDEAALERRVRAVAKAQPQARPKPARTRHEPK